MNKNLFFAAFISLISQTFLCYAADMFDDLEDNDEEIISLTQYGYIYSRMGNLNLAGQNQMVESTTVLMERTNLIDDAPQNIHKPQPRRAMNYSLDQ